MLASDAACGAERKAAWSSAASFRLLLNVDARGLDRSFSPASVEVDFHQALRDLGSGGAFDEATIQVFELRGDGMPRQFDLQQRDLHSRRLVPWRLDKLIGSTRARLNFVLRDHQATNLAVYFDTKESGHSQPRRHPGMVGDGDLFIEQFGRREISASHFDHFFDFDGDGDLDLFKGGVEPFVYCFENVGDNRFEPRGRLTSGGKLFTLPKNEGSNRSWVTVTFHDWDGDGQPDFFPSFQDGPDAGRIIFYRNTTREHAGVLTFERIGPLATTSGTPLAGGAQTGGWFPSITFVSGGWDGASEGRADVLVGSKNQCWLHRNLGMDDRAFPRLGDAVAVQANGTNIVLLNPRFDVADVDRDGDLDLFAGTQPGPVWFYKNNGPRNEPRFAPGVAVAWTGRYLIGDAHSGVKVADWDHDGMPDILGPLLGARGPGQPPATRPLRRLVQEHRPARGGALRATARRRTVHGTVPAVRCHQTKQRSRRAFIRQRTPGTGGGRHGWVHVGLPQLGHSA